MKKLSTFLLVCMIALCLSAYGGDSTNTAISSEQAQNQPSSVTTESSTVTESEDETTMEETKKLAKDNAQMQKEDASMPTRIIENRTRINMHFGDTVIPGILNDSETAQALIDMLPCTVPVNRHSYDYCGTTSNGTSPTVSQPPSTAPSPSETARPESPSQNPQPDSATPVFDLDTKTVRLNSGYDMPILGLGTYALTDDVCVNSVTTLLENGGRLIDTASFYGTEDSVGEAVRNSIVPRKEIFVTTKLYPNQYANAAQAIDEALKELDIEYIDLMLLHHPSSNDVAAYKALEQAVADGKIRSIGLSNYYIKELSEFLPKVTITPAVVQNEIHPYYQDIDVVPFIQSYGIVVEGWFPFGGRGHTSELFNDSVIKGIAETHQVSSAQVILKWNLQRGVVVIPGSSSPEHIKKNLDLFDFELTEAEIEQIKALNRNEKHEWY